MALDLHSPHDVVEEMAHGEHVVLHFHPNVLFPANTAPRAVAPWRALSQPDQSVIYVHRDRERAAVAMLENPLIVLP